MNRLLIHILGFAFLASCTGVKLPRSDFKTIDNKFNGTFVNAPFKIKGRLPHKSLLSVFEIYPAEADTVNLRFNSSGELILSFNNSRGGAAFTGKFKRGFYQVYIRRKNIQIPPLLPIFYSHRDIHRIRIALTKDNTLVIDNKWAMDGNIFLMAAGGRGRRQYQFKNNGDN